MQWLHLTEQISLLVEFSVKYLPKPNCADVHPIASPVCKLNEFALKGMCCSWHSQIWKPTSSFQHKLLEKKKVGQEKAKEKFI